MGPTASAAAGDRGVSVGGDVVGSVIVTGDNNSFKLVLGPEQGALLELLARNDRPSKRLRPEPIRLIERARPGTVDREREVRGILDGVSSPEPVNVYGPRGVGKTYVVLRALNVDHPALAHTVVYLYANGPLEDVLQQVFETWYECDPPFRPSITQLRRDVGPIRGVLALDSVTLDRDAAQQLILAMPECRLVVCSRERVLWEGTAIALGGLDRQSALAVVEQELGRPLSDDERDAAGRICDAVAGHPLRIRESVATWRELGRPLIEAASAASSLESDASVAQEKLEDAGESGRQLLASVAVFGDASVGEDHLRAVAAVDDFDSVLAGALRRGDISAGGARYSVGAVLGSAPGSLDVDAAGDRALRHYTEWARRMRGEPSALLTEADGLLAVLRWAVGSGRGREAIALGRNVDHAFALARRFGAWKQVLELVHAAARNVRDQDAEAWTLHQLGTRSICLGDLEAGSALLDQAIKLRRELGDEPGADSSAHNRAVAARSGWLRRWTLGRTPLLLIVLVAAVALIGGALAATQGGSARGHSNAKATLVLHVQGTGHAASDPAGIDCPARCSARFASSTRVTLRARAGARARFVGWSGACSGHTSCTVNANGTTTVFARFAAVQPPPGNRSHTTTTTVRTSDSTTVHSTTAASSYTLTVVPQGSGSGTVTSNDMKIDCPTRCMASYAQGTPVTLTARSASFAGWSGACTTTSATCSLTMNSDHTATPIFSAPSYTLTVMVISSGPATVTSNDMKIDCSSTCSASYAQGTPVTLSASAGQLLSWSSGSCPGTGSCTVTMSSDQTVTARFAAAQ